MFTEGRSWPARRVFRQRTEINKKRPTNKGRKMSDIGGSFQVEFVSTKAASAILAKGEGRMWREGIF